MGRYRLGDDDDDEGADEGAEPEESLAELDDPDVADEQHPATAAPDSDVPTPSAAKPVRRATPTKRIIRRPKAKAAVKRVFAKKPQRKRAPKGKRRRVGMLYIP